MGKTFKIGGHCVYSEYRHYILEYNLMPDISPSLLIFERLTIDNVNQIRGGGFSVSNVIRLLKKDVGLIEGFLFRTPNSGEIVGFGILGYKGAKEFHYTVNNVDAFIVELAVMPLFRRQGFSQEILSCINSICFKKGFHSIKLAVKTDNFAALAAYKKFGFNKVKEIKFKRFLRLEFPFHKKV